LVALVGVEQSASNQFNLNEKSRQVQDMLVIFQKAEKVLSWIGMPLNPFSNPFDRLKEYTQTRSTWKHQFQKAASSLTTSQKRFRTYFHRLGSEEPGFDRKYSPQDVLPYNLDNTPLSVTSPQKILLREPIDLSASARQGLHAFENTTLAQRSDKSSRM